MVLTAENYYSQEANEEYMSVSQFKDFCGTYGKMPCEFTAMEKLKGRWEEPKSKALMVGSYVDSYFEGTLYTFKKKNPDLFKRDGSLKAEFVKADEIIQRIERDLVEMNMARVLAVKSGDAEPDRCELCDCCRKTRVLKAPISITDLTAGI